MNLYQCKYQVDGPTCQYESTIQAAAEKTVLIAYS